MRHKNQNWNLPDDPIWDAVKVAVLMDIRDELQKLNAVFACPNFLAIPSQLAQVVVNTTRVKRRRRRVVRA